MSRKKLTSTEVTKRLSELRNLQRLHRHDREQISDYAEALRIVEAENAELKQTVATLQIQMAELQQMVFGKKKKPPMGGKPVAPDLFAAVPTVRSKASYRRPIPPATAITTEVAVPLPATCDHCGSSDGFDPDSVTTHDRYVEDIPLPELTPDYQAKLVTKYVISKGRCNQCGKATTGNDTNLGGAQVALGPNVRLLVTHLIAGMGMSYNGVAQLLRSLYGITVSDGEVANILAKQHQAWLPAYNQLKADIRASPSVHADETS